jgi:hypothetical protein
MFFKTTSTGLQSTAIRERDKVYFFKFVFSICTGNDTYTQIFIGSTVTQDYCHLTSKTILRRTKLYFDVQNIIRQAKTIIDKQSLAMQQIAKAHQLRLIVM